MLVYTDSDLHNADADPDEEGPGDEWMALEGLRVRSGHDALACEFGENRSRCMSKGS